MHRCLRIPELAQQIVDSLVPTQDERVKDYVLLNDQPVMSALARLARTSKTFQDYALSKLWETQFGIQNLVLCMPDDLFYDLTSLTSVAGTFIPYRFIHFKRALEPRDWARFDYYAQFIKYLGCPTLDSAPLLVGMSSDVYSALARYHRHPRPYLPRLRSLTFRAMAQPSELSDICMAFLGPSVTSFTVASGPTDSASSLTALTQAPLLAPSLEQLDIDFRWSPDPSRLLVGALKTLRKLRVLRLTLPTEPLGEIWAAVADLPSLTSLYVGRDELGAEVDSSPSDPAVERLNGRIQFAQLIDLSLLNFRMSNSIDLLDRLDLPNLTDLTLSPFRDDLYPCERLFDTIAKRCPPSLSKLRIEPPSRQAHAPRVEASARSFRALQAFHDLRVLRLSSVRDLTDELLFEIADAWPALEELTLLPARSSSPEMSATLLGLTYVAETCRNLHTLALNFRPFFGTSAQSSWPHGAPPRGTRPNTRVKTLDVHTAWPIYGDGVQVVAAVLAESFASLETIRELGVEAEETWREVQDLLPALRAERSGVRCGLDTLERRG